MGTQAELKHALKTQAPYLMGVLNVTPDSFSDGGCFIDEQRAIAHAWEIAQAGAHIIDIGGQSTGPGAKTQSLQVELDRISGVVQALAKRLFISVDTYRAEVAAFCLSQGVRMINDVSALRADPDMPKLIAKHGAFAVLMHSKETPEHPGATTGPKTYLNIIAEIEEFLGERLEFVLSQGIAPNKIILDPGMGSFVSDDRSYSWEILARLNELCDNFSPYAVLVGTSRKSFLGGKVSERDPLSQLTGLIASLKGASIIRTHNVKMASEFFAAWDRSYHLHDGKKKEG